MIFKGKLTLEEYRRYHLLYARTRYVLIFAVLFAGSFMFKFGSSLAGRFGINPLAANLAVAIAASLVITLFLFASYYIRIKPMFEADETLNLDQEYEAKDEGINTKSEKGEHMILWTEIKSVRYYHDFIILSMGTYYAVLIPLRYFNNEGEIQEFKKIIEGKVDKK